MLPELLAVQLTKDQPENHKKQLRESYTPTVFFPLVASHISRAWSQQSCCWFEVPFQLKANQPEDRVRILSLAGTACTFIHHVHVCAMTMSERLFDVSLF